MKKYNEKVYHDNYFISILNINKNKQKSRPVFQDSPYSKSISNAKLFYRKFIYYTEQISLH